MTRFGPYSFLNLLLLSVVLFALFPLGTNTAGFAALLWGALLASRIVWLFDSLFTRRPKTIRNNMLPFILLAGMERRRKTKTIEAAHQIFNIHLFIWLLCALLYAAAILVTFSPTASLSPNIYVTIEAFMIAEGQTLNSFNTVTVQGLLISMSHLGTVAVAFMLAQLYAYTHKDMHILWVVPLALFVIQLFAYAIFFGAVPAALSLPQGAQSFVYLLAFVPGMAFLQALRKSRPRKVYGALGLMILVLLAVCDLTLNLPENTAALWLCAWSAIAVLWVRAQGDGDSEAHKTYLLY